ncbi:MAG TPA: hypothetical protein VFF27_11455 [Bacteroidia bacterium]|jgi:tetratricopeptide (TPR) repeat protein|nr:hypothetical protein [Bacteroidia bacterium]
MNFLFRSTLNFVLSVALLCIIVCSCNNSKTSETGDADGRLKQREVIHDLESKMKVSPSLNNSLARTAVQQYFSYAAAYPDDSLTADYLFKGGQIATAVGDYQGALHAYEKITTAYPAFPYVRESLYLQGFLLDNYINDDAKAKVVYEKFLATYTSGPYIEDAKAAIANLGKSDEELMKEFKAMNEKK